MLVNNKIAIAAALILSVVGPAHAAPLLAENSAHVTYNIIPLGPLSGGGRYQQVYAASLFGGATTINSLAFSPDTTATWGADITITLSHTSVAVGALSATLGNNVTGAETVVFSQAGFSQAVTGGSESFSLVFDISDFAYNGVDNLLLDIDVANISYNGGGFSRSDPGTVFSRASDSGTGSNSADGVGLRTHFDVGSANVSEPVTLALLGLGLAGIGYGRRKQIKAA